MFLYVITNRANGKLYVGIATAVDQRWREHLSGRGSKLVHQAIQKYGRDKLDFEVWYEGDEAWIKMMERRAIVMLNTSAPHGYNLTLGGDGTLGWRPSDAFRKKVSRFHFGRRRSMETRAKMSKAQKTCAARDGSHQRLGNAHRGHQHSAEARKQMSEKARLRLPHLHPAARRVLADGVEYGSLKDAAIDIGVRHGTLSMRFRRWHRSGKWPVGFGYLVNTEERRNP